MNKKIEKLIDALNFLDEIAEQSGDYNAKIEQGKAYNLLFDYIIDSAKKKKTRKAVKK